MTETLLFIDADNQSPVLAIGLVRFLKAVGRTVTCAVVAGNGSVDRVCGLEQALKEAAPGVEVQCNVAPVRKQSADVRLMFALAPYYHGEPDPSVLIVIVSRDELFIAATECPVTRGHNAVLAIGRAPNGVPTVGDVPVILLASPSPPAPPIPVVAANSAVAKVQTVTSSSGTIDPKVVTAAITRIRQTLSPNKQGGYAASAVGQVLSQMGHDKAMRTKIVGAIPHLKEAGAGSEKRLIF